MTPEQRRAAGRLQAILTPEHTARCVAELEGVPSDDAELQDRVSRLKAGDLSAVLRLDPEDARDESAFSLTRLGGDAPRCRELARSLQADWFLEALSGGEETDLVETGTVISTGDLVPTTGLWLAGCPNLLLEGTAAPEAIWVTEAVTYDDGVLDWETERRPAVWTLLGPDRER